MKGSLIIDKMVIIAQGAEAILERERERVIKRRVKKGYRLAEIDEMLRKARTKKEAKLLEKAGKLIHVPKLIMAGKYELDIEYIDGKKLSENLDGLRNGREVCVKIGENIAKLHDAGIIHGDLTTSNMIYVEKSNKEREKKQLFHKINKINNAVSFEDSNSETLKDKYSFKVYFIDFGLGFESTKVEDRAVDLHLIKEALEAKHFARAEKFWKAVIEGYKISGKFRETVKRLEVVEKRGRYKGQY